MAGGCRPSTSRTDKPLPDARLCWVSIHPRGASSGCSCGSGALGLGGLFTIKRRGQVVKLARILRLVGALTGVEGLDDASISFKHLTDNRSGAGQTKILRAAQAKTVYSSAKRLILV